VGEEVGSEEALQKLQVSEITPYSSGAKLKAKVCLL
jgi:hypothetical protein